MSSKWNPFNAVAPGGFMVNEVLREKNKIDMPVLSDDQKTAIQERILEVHNNQEIVKIKYFRGGRLYITEGKVEKIDINAHKIVLNGGFSVFFSQIVEIL